MGGEVFPFRMNVRPVAAFAGPLEFKPPIGDLTLITNKKMWSGHLRQAMRDIPGGGLPVYPQGGPEWRRPMPEKESGWQREQSLPP